MSLGRSKNDKRRPLLGDDEEEDTRALAALGRRRRFRPASIPAADGSALERISYLDQSDSEGRPLPVRSISRRSSSLFSTGALSNISVTPTPLPRAQIAVLCIMRFSEPVAFLCIMPFIPRMLRDNMPDVPPEQIGYYAGFIESIFALVQFLTGFLWGRASDKFGRKPILLIGLVGVGVSMNFFGLAKTLPEMIVARAIAGLMNANVSVLKSTLGELTDETNQARAFSLLPLCFAFGSMIGPTIGGALSNPADSIPIFSGSQFLKRYPYWLPCFCASLFNVAGLIAGFFFLSETLPSKVRQTRHAQAAEQRKRARAAVADEEQAVNATGEHVAAAAGVESDESSDEEDDGPAPTIRQMLTRPVLFALANSGMINFVNICYLAVLPLFCDAPIGMGGLSMSKAEIGYYLAANGVVTICVQLVAFPRLERRWGGPLPTLRRCLLVLPGVFLCFMLAHFAAREFGRPALVAALCLLLTIRGASSMMVVSSNLCVNNVVPHRAALGSINGMSQSLASLARAVGPIVITSSFAFSISHLRRFMDGQAVWLVFSAVALVTWWTSSRMEVPRTAAWRLSAGRK